MPRTGGPTATGKARFPTAERGTVRCRTRCLEVGKSPFVDALNVMGIPGGPDTMNAVVLVAVLSCLNSSLYTASRMMFVLANQSNAPRSVARVDKNGVPRGALLAALCVGLGWVELRSSTSRRRRRSHSPVNASGATILMVYLMIALSQIKLRSMLGPEACATWLRLVCRVPGTRTLRDSAAPAVCHPRGRRTGRCPCSGIYSICDHKWG
ncbi:hypothetical protein [Rhodococcus sp. T7]|uniref:hypothetical protein n=1 Tax=Rhodococcus sp. T7 TaxID=627444 RepID=UPI0022A89B5D|nr:hypothetical protein [Rhodococcus sp. T7]